MVDMVATMVEEAREAACMAVVPEEGLVVCSVAKAITAAVVETSHCCQSRLAVVECSLVT